MKSKLWFFAAVALLCSACATTAHQTEAILKNRADLAESARVENVEFVEQSRYFCGPATLAMAMGWAGHKVSAEALGEQVYTPGKKGSLQSDMITTSRRQGMLAMQISGLPALLRELEAGHPVIVLENLAFTWYPMWHYSVVFGYDLKEPSLLMHSGSKQNWRLSMRKFERNWKYAGYWALVVLPPGELSASASELEHCTAAAGLEQLGYADKAEMSYQRILMRWPQSLGALIGMGNVTYARGEWKEAVRFLRLAVKHHPESIAAQHNLRVAEEAARRKAPQLGKAKSRTPAKIGLN